MSKAIVAAETMEYEAPECIKMVICSEG